MSSTLGIIVMGIYTMFVISLVLSTIDHLTYDNKKKRLVMGTCTLIVVSYVLFSLIFIYLGGWRI